MLFKKYLQIWFKVNQPHGVIIQQFKPSCLLNYIEKINNSIIVIEI